MEQPHLWRRLFESAPDRYLVLDARLRVTGATDEYLSTIGAHRDDLVGRDVFAALAGRPAAPVAAALGASLGRVRRSLTPDAMTAWRDGTRADETYWSAVNVPVLGDGRSLERIVHRLEDVTERARANAHLRAANDAKNQFLSRMSHELRSPLTAVIGFSELLAGSELDDQQRQRLGMIRKASDHLLALMNEVLDLTRIESGSISISPEPLLLAPILDEVAELMRPLATANAVHVRPPQIDPGAECVFADNQRLKQVLLNLVSNAIKYNRPRGDVRVHVEAEGEDEIRISVSDTGRGLDAAAIGRLFVPFERLDAAAAGIDGTGLGLVLSRTLLEAMGGRIAVTSEPGAGSCFCAVVPRGTPLALPMLGEDGGADAFDVRAGDEPRTLLYIEDTLANVLLLRGILEHRPNARLLSAAHGELGLSLAREHRPDLILLDLHLPDVSGEEVLARLRSDDATREIPVLVLSADASRERAPLLLAGAAAYLTKPVALRRLLDVVDRFLYQHTEVPTKR